MRSALVLFVALPLHAHVMSMSTGDVTVNGNRVEYVIRMPLYEIVHTAHPETELLRHIQFTGGRVAHQTCFEERAQDSYVCAADYEFPAPVERLDVTCTLYAVTVPNHVHLLRAQMGGKHDQAIFDYTFTSATLRFRPPTAAEIAAIQIGAGALRAVGGAIQVLFLISLALAARTWRELAAIAGAFLAGLVAGGLINWHPPPRFVEAAAALSIAYLAVEILFLPAAGTRWAIAGVLGIFQGLYLALFLNASGFQARYFLTGAVGAAIATVAIFAAIAFPLRRRSPKLAERAAASALLATGLAWFVMRLRG